MLVARDWGASFPFVVVHLDLDIGRTAFAAGFGGRGPFYTSPVASDPGPDPDMSLQPKPRYTFADYLADEVFAMTGASYRHNQIVANIVRHLGNRLADRPCTVLASDMRVRVEAGDLCAHPDVIALCQAPLFHDDCEGVLTNPTLIIEVLSRSIDGCDRGENLALYRLLPSLRQYVLISQDRAAVDLYTREADNRWELSAYTDSMRWL